MMREKTNNYHKNEEYRMNQVIAEDMQYIRNKINTLQIDGKTVLISGATGLIGRYLVSFLIKYCRCSVIAIVRDIEKARLLWEDVGDFIELIHSDIKELEISKMSVDYMIHAACDTASKSFAVNPVEVIYTSVEGTRRMLEIARCSGVKRFVYLSTMEVYGAPCIEEKIVETQGTTLDTMSARSSYPESKRLCESMCAAYFAEYQVPVQVVRLTQTFGPGVVYNDARVFAEFARCVIERKDIVLHTDGGTKRSYLYLADACAAILIVMAKGRCGEAYNAANEETYCSIKQMADLVADHIAEGKITVRVAPDKELQKIYGYAPALKVNLDTSKLQEIGWKPETGLVDMYKRMITCMKNEMNI